MALDLSADLHQHRTVVTWAALAGGVAQVDVVLVFVVADGCVYGIIERPGQEKAFWSRIGVAFRNRDGSINLLLDFFPRDSTTGLQVRWAEEEEN
jgi:hypothetical protein